MAPSLYFSGRTCWNASIGSQLTPLVRRLVLKANAGQGILLLSGNVDAQLLRESRHGGFRSGLPSILVKC